MINHPIVITDVKEKLAEVELLGHDAEVIAKDIYDILDIVLGEWQCPKFLPGALVPVVLGAVNRAVLVKLREVQESLKHEEGADALYGSVALQIADIEKRIKEREDKKPLEEAA